MALSTAQIFKFYDKVALDARAVTAPKIVQQMLLASLAPQRRKVFECVYDAGRGGITSSEIARKLKLSISSVGNALNELRRYELLGRSEYRNENGVYYKYWAGLER